MSNLRKWIIAFWIFIGVMLAWQFYSFNEGIKRKAIEHPTQEHFFFNNQLPQPGQATAVTQTHGADVRQVKYTAENNTPYTGSFTVHITLKNFGDTKAMGVQIAVRPYRGGMTINRGEEDTTPLNESNPLSDFSQWVNFPDLAPGESSTQTAIFADRESIEPGPNKDPKIVFAAEPAKH